MLQNTVHCVADNRLKYGTNNRPLGTVPKRVPARDSCKDCPICLERQRRPLATYIRSKSRQDRKKDALEEDVLEEEQEEQDLEQEEQQQKQEQQEKPAPK